MPKDLPERLNLLNGYSLRWDRAVKCYFIYNGLDSNVGEMYGMETEFCKAMTTPDAATVALVKRLVERLKKIDALIVFENHGFSRSFNDDLEQDVKDATAWLEKGA